jgi:Zn-dependent peptidase ImmA (M78 family)/transcriptional regulator with XRE-family HTH domain
MKSEGVTFNPSMVTLAREALGLTQGELADRVGVSQGTLSKLEAGALEPAPETLALLAGELRVPESFFFQRELLTGPSVSEFFHRRRQDVPAKLLRQAHATINIILLHLGRLLRSAEVPDCRIPKQDADAYHSVAEVARAVRAMWGLPAGPIHNLIHSIEAAGGIVIRCALGSPRVDAISRWVPGLPPVFFLNSGQPADRERLSLAHELGHMILHHAPTDDMEMEANAFAGEFLMPASDIRSDFGEVTLYRLGVLKPYWRSSMAALLHRAADLKMVSERTARFLWMQMGKAGYRRREPPELDIATEEPRLLQELLRFHLEDLGYELEQLADLLCALPSVLSAQYSVGASGRGQRLRLLK